MFSRSRNRNKNSADSDESKSPRSPTEGRSAFGRKGKAKEEGASKEAADTVSALPTESTSPVSAGSKAPPKLDRKFSTLSQQTVDTLETLEAQIKVMSVSADDAEKARAAGSQPCHRLASAHLSHEHPLVDSGGRDCLCGRGGAEA